MYLLFTLQFIFIEVAAQNINQRLVKYTLYTENNTITKWQTVKQCLSAHLNVSNEILTGSEIP